MYYRGQSLATLVFRPANKHRIDMHHRFFDGADLETPTDFVHKGSYVQMEVDARGARRILKRSNVGKLMRAIRDVNHSLVRYCFTLALVGVV